ncbi:hypothetical protein [Pseudanabaena mucicola]|uniref:Uncharacterized protein n=1 Tax=Pseudanabaena mucicola FACHB-723 TaxID=2692860 RepID=A0ABR7ZXS1_9CYAN|nr:hypothetical protein [Pseudanabaena mucicola]MBD2188300.1 hypothetical protein [Pseudanabaena mucicola FACHB-723]
MENWEFLLQRKGDKSWLPLESPTVEILEGQYRLAARSALANALVGIAIAYRPLADVRHQPLQQKLVKRISHDGLVIVMPYTNFVAGLWQIDCLAAESETESGSESASIAPAWKATVKFDVIPVSSDFGSDWQYIETESEEDVETSAESEPTLATNTLGIEQPEQKTVTYSSPILDIAEQRSTELVQSMFEEFAIFEEEDEDENLTDGSSSGNDELDDNYQNLETEEISRQPRILLRLHQPQYIVNPDNSFNLTGEIYTKGEVEVTLKNPQTLDVIINKRFAIADLGERNPSTGTISFNYQIIVPPPSEVQVLIGEVQIHPQKDFQQYQDLFITQQAIAVSYPASRVLPELIKEVQTQEKQIQEEQKLIDAASNSESFPQFPQGFPQATNITIEPTENRSGKPKTTPALSLPPLPSNKPKSSSGDDLQLQTPRTFLSLPPLPPLKKTIQKKAVTAETTPINSNYFEEEIDSFPQEEIDSTLSDQNIQLSLDIDSEEPELMYSFEEELPQNYEEILAQPSLEITQPSNNLLPNFKQTGNEPPRNNRFLTKLQTLSADAIAAQKASQRTEELLLDTFPVDPLLDAEAQASNLNMPLIDSDNNALINTEELTSLAKLDVELDQELDRLLSSEPDLSDLMLNEYVWEETVDPNTFPISGLSSQNLTVSNLSETAKTIRNVQESSSPVLPDQEPIPVPEIIVPTGEIISGTPMSVTVRLPALQSKFFVKFWIKDLQTRMIVDGPRWLLDFSTIPNAEFIETRTNISIPLSSIDVAFEAIAIESHTQRESHKVRVTRAVTPPNLAQDIDFDEP